MAILIMNLIDALDYKPQKPTYAIRIKGSDWSDKYFSVLNPSDNYANIETYTFDDIDRSERGKILFNSDIAKAIIADFIRERSNVEDLLVHCIGGNNRSPAIAIAMNRIFGLGEDEERMKKEHRFTTWWMANLILDTASKMSLISPDYKPFRPHYFDDDSE